MTAERAGAAQQLSLDLAESGPGSTPALPARLGFPLATHGGGPFDDEERFFEPWWPGAHAFLRRAGPHVELRTEHLGDPLLAFPDLREVALDLRADGVIIEGTLLALDGDGRPDARLLRRLLSGALADDEAVEGAFVASDMPYLDGRPLARQPYVERRRRLAAVLPESVHCVLGRGLVGEGLTLGKAAASLGLGAISAHRLDARWRAGPSGDDWLRLRVSDSPDEPRHPFLVLLERLPLGD